MSEYTARYQHVSHKELYDGVNAGDPTQIDGLAAGWDSMKGTLDDLARDLKGDLEKLGNTWTGDAGREFQRRLSLIVDYSTTLSEGMADVRQGLTLMATHLRTAQKKAESPEETDDHDKAVSGAVKGGAMFGLPGAIVGGIVGHQQDKEEQEKAHQRMVQVVSELAAGYDLSAYGRMVSPPDPHEDLPYHPDTDTTTPSAGPGATTPGSVGGTGGSPTTGHKTMAAPKSPAHGPTGGSGLPGGDTGGGTTGGGTIGGTGTGTYPGTGTSLAGADPSLASPLPVAGGPTTTGLAGGGASTSGSGLLFGAPVGAAAGGLIAGGTGVLAGSGSGATAPAARPAGPTPAADNRAATGVGRAQLGKAGAAGNRAGLLGGHGHGDEDESAERLTWLTEDEMVWSDGETAAPPVLGAS
ncbi:WXG100 family type VII secretion target [Micromonospora olivasterospora]|uniref:Type VII secretion system (Wss) protein ESAT-6 n=1 Tax=Micromonospora olivasterospora TaxID=1880 RepID=A0A562IAP0_MICOL|nr:WXG100 family type VII secretion target [Micromonospora olivasterospora]TWH68067.1 type VII secretion system (Wss) protein ESAT-6 [Micromonospora olivasterospora]